MSFGRRQGWLEGVVLVNGRPRARCNILTRTETRLVFEAPDLGFVPYLFAVEADGAVMQCEFKFQKGTQISAVITRISSSSGGRSALPIDEPPQMPSWRPLRGFNRAAGSCAKPRHHCDLRIVPNAILAVQSTKPLKQYSEGSCDGSALILQCRHDKATETTFSAFVAWSLPVFGAAIQNG